MISIQTLFHVRIYLVLLFHVINCVFTMYSVSDQSMNVCACECVDIAQRTVRYIHANERAFLYEFIVDRRQGIYSVK